MKTLLTIVIIGLLVSTGCAPELGEYVPRKREYKSPVEFKQATEKPSNGGLWTPSQQGNFMFMDRRARAVGDIVTVVIEEMANASRGASATLDRESAMSNAIGDILGLFKLLQPELVGMDLLNTKTNSDFKGGGTTTRTERLQATVPATVMNVLPNGNLYVSGYRVVLVNNEEHQFHINGVVRPSDITDGNIIKSNRIAEAEVKFTGRGDITRKLNPGYLNRVIDEFNPF